jgi:hypothetical protein
MVEYNQGVVLRGNSPSYLRTKIEELGRDAGLIPEVKYE